MLQECREESVGSVDISLPGTLFAKLRSLSLKEFAYRLIPQQIDVVFYRVCLGSRQAMALAKVDVSIEKTVTDSGLTYRALVDGRFAHRSVVRAFSLRPVQFNFGAKPVIVDCFTQPEFRGLHIYPHVLSYVLCDLQNTTSMREIYIWTDVKNRPSILAIERVGFEFVAHCKGIRVGPFMLRPWQCYDRQDLLMPSDEQ